LVVRATIVISMLSPLLIAGCATTPPAQLGIVELCYEQQFAARQRAIEVAQEIQLRGENCDKYQVQIAQMMQINAQKRARAATSLQLLGQQSSPKSIDELYWEPQKAYRQKSTVTCRSQKEFGGVINTTCQ